MTKVVQAFNHRIHFQYYPKWYWPKHTKSFDKDYSLHWNFFVIGPLQFQWFSK